MVLLVLVVILPAVVTVIPGVLRILYRADAQVTLRHTKSVRLVLQMTGMETYGGSRSFCDASREGASQRASGRFCCQEGDFTVWYQSDPGSYSVYRNEMIISPKILQDE